jgi:hypothetical protein
MAIPAGVDLMQAAFDRVLREHSVALEKLKDM